MSEMIFAEAGAPVSAFKLPAPTMAQVDEHPDRDFIWSVILATRRACGNRRAIRPYLD